MATLNLNEKKIPSAENLRLIAQLCISLANKQSSLEDRCIAPWKSGEVYQKDISYVSYNNYLYFCTVSNSDTDFVESHWTKLSDTISELTKSDIAALINLSPEEISKLSDLISTEIRLDKTFSSSDTYTRIQAAIDTAKEYTNNQLGKAVKPAYKVVSSTSEVTETGYFYLISNGTNYDMYVLSADGSVVYLDTSEVDLSNYYTKTEVDNGFLKKTDAASTYATITTVDGKIDKTSIATTLGDSVTDDQVTSAFLTKTELGKINESMGKLSDYSTEETLTGGKWIDGKPIYRKIFTFTDVSTDIDLSELNIETPIFVNYIANDKNRNWSIGTYPAQSTIQYDEYVKTGYYDSTQKKWIWQFGSVVRQKLVDGYFIIEYTKA